MITDLEISLDQVGHALTGPQRGFITQSLGALVEQAGQAGSIGLIQTGKSAGAAGTLKCHVTACLLLLPPAANRLVADLQTTTDCAVVEALVKQLDRSKPTFLQCHKVAFHASRIAHTGIRRYWTQIVPLYYAGFSNLPIL